MGSYQKRKFRTKSLKKVKFTSLTGNNLNCSAIFLDLQLSKHTHVGVLAKNQAAAITKLLKRIKL